MLYTEYKPLWTSVNGVGKTFPWLSEDISCEVVVVGGGITGAFTALRFAEEGIDTVLVTNKPVGYCATSDSNGLLHADGTVALTDLAEQYGTEKARKIYQASYEAVDAIASLCERFQDNCGFYRTDSLLYTVSPTRAKIFLEEALLRKSYGFDVEYLENPCGGTAFTFPFAAGVRTKNGSAVVDPYRLVQNAVKMASELGARVYEYSEIGEIRDNGGSLDLVTTLHKKITAQKAVLATGTEAREFLGCTFQKRTSFSIATQPLQDIPGWPERCVLRDDDHPEVTYSITPDNRVYATGLETGLREMGGRFAGIIPIDALAEKKFENLQKNITKMFPAAGTIRKDFRSVSSYVRSKSGLPIIGERAEYPGCLFALCGGISGIVHAEIASRVLLKLHKGETPELAELFSPNEQ